MAEMIADLITGDRVGEETDYRSALPVNMSGINKKIFGVIGYMLQQPGLTKYGEGIGIDRGGLWNEKQKNHYRVSGNALINVDVNGNSTVLVGTGVSTNPNTTDATNITGLGTASLPYSFTTQGIVTDGKFWLYDVTNGLVEVTDPDLGNPLDCVWVDGYYFLTDGINIYHTNIADETAIDPLKFATAEFSPDPTLGVGKTVDNKVMAFGRYTIEYFRNIAAANFAFTRIPTRAIKAGIVGTHCKAEMMNSWFIMGGRKEEDVSIHIVGVGDVNKVASREVDKIISQYTEDQLSVSVLEARVIDDYHYMIVHLPNETLMLNVDMLKTAGIDGAWTILKTGTIDKQWRAKHGLFEPRLGKWVYGDKQGSNLGVLDDSVSTQYDEISEWVLNTPFMYFDGLTIDELDIQIIPGFTFSPDATVFLSLTYNGVTHGMEASIDYGLPSEYDKRFIVYNLGHVDGFVSIKLRGASRSRMAFSKIKLQVA